MKHLPFVLALFAASLLGTPASHAIQIPFTAVMDGASEFPSNASPGTGIASAIYDNIAHTLTIHAEFSNLVLSGSGTTVAHIHCCTPTPNALNQTVGVAVTPGTLPGFPVGVRAGVYDFVVDLTNLANYTGGATGFLTRVGATTAAQAEAALFAGLVAETAYFNIHTSAFPNGEIRGFLQMPEPGALALLGLGLLVLGFARCRTV